MKMKRDFRQKLQDVLNKKQPLQNTEITHHSEEEEELDDGQARNCYD